MELIRLEANGAVHGKTAPFVLVDEGSDTEKLWRSHGYLPEAEIGKKQPTPPPFNPDDYRQPEGEEFPVDTAGLESLRDQWRSLNPGREPDKRWREDRLMAEIQKTAEG
jgi:hypothetical protein